MSYNIYNLWTALLVLVCLCYNFQTESLLADHAGGSTAYQALCVEGCCRTLKQVIFSVGLQPIIRDKFRERQTRYRWRVHRCSNRGSLRFDCGGKATADGDTEAAHGWRIGEPPSRCSHPEGFEGKPDRIYPSNGHHSKAVESLVA